MIPKIQIFIESVILGVGVQNRGAGCSVIVMNQHRKVVAQYAGQNVKGPDVVKQTATEALNQLKTLCDISVYSSARQPRGFKSGPHPLAWRTIPEGSDGWQMRATGAAWEVALGGAVTREILELAATDPVEPKEKGMFIYASNRF
jgi:hypothetical protein